MIDRNTFLNAIFADKTDDELICVTRGTSDGQGGSYFTNSLSTDRVFTDWDSDAEARAFYFCVSTVDGGRKAQPDGKGRVTRARANLLRAHCLVLDDVGTKATEPPVQPSWKIETSEGNYQWGYILEPTSNLTEYEAFVSWCAEQGWADAGAGGSYRVMRVPGSANLKAGRDEFRSVVTEWNAVSFTMAGLAASLGCDLSTLELRTPGVVPAAVGVAVDVRDGVDDLLDWLVAGSKVTADDGGEWVKIVCPWQSAHTSGDGTAGYSPLGRGRNGSVQRRSFSCLHEHCKQRKTKDFVDRCVEDGGPEVATYDPMPWLQDTYVYIESGQQVADVHQRQLGGVWLWELTDWKLRHPGSVSIPGRDRPVALATAFLQDQNTVRAVDTKYLPVSRNVPNPSVVESKGQNYVNTFKHPLWEKNDRVPQVFVDHMDYLIPNEMERETFINWLAYKVQNPDKRSFCVVMVAEDVYGTGRSWLKDMISLAIGGGINTASLGQLIGKGTSAEQTYNDWMAECQFVVVEEAKDNSTDMNDFYHGFESFKELVDTKVSYDRRINPKYGRTRYENVYFNALIFTNHADALAIPEGDRRVMVIANPTTLASPAYYENLHRTLENPLEASALYWWLQQRDISGFDPVYPPETDSKRVMILENESPATSVLRWVEENTAPDVVSKQTLTDAIMRAANELGFSKYSRDPHILLKPLWRKLKTLDAAGKHGRRIQVRGTQTELRAIRNKPKWAAADTTDLEKEYVSNQGKVISVVFPT